MNLYSVAVLVGSLRAQSFSRKIANALIANALTSLACRIVEIGDLPLYNEDLEQQAPASWERSAPIMPCVRLLSFLTSSQCSSRKLTSATQPTYSTETAH